MISPKSLSLTATLLASTALAQARLVLPPGYENLEGGSGHTYPWASGTAWSPFGSRVQVIYDSIYFTSQGWTGPQGIQRLRLRADGSALPVSSGGTYSNVRIDLSTATVNHRRPSSTYDNNHGLDRQTVVSGTVTLLPTFNQAPNVWYIDLTLATPFVYDPGNGDLVVDMAVPDTWSGGTPGRTDGVSGMFGGVVEATTLFHRFSSQAPVAEWISRDFGFVMSLDFSGSGQATTGTYGTGCAAPLGTPLALQALSRPVTGTSFDVGVQNLPQGTTIGFFLLGLTQLQPGIDLGPLGAPGCRQYVGLTGSRADSFQPLGSVGVQSYALPPDPSFAGLPVFVQAAGFAPGVNAFGLLTSNGVDAVVGTF